MQIYILAEIFYEIKYFRKLEKREATLITFQAVEYDQFETVVMNFIANDFKFELHNRTFSENSGSRINLGSI
jgi:hypothetical protein